MRLLGYFDAKDKGLGFRLWGLGTRIRRNSVLSFPGFSTVLVGFDPQASLRY